MDADGSRHVRYDRTFRGLRVIGGDFVVAKAPRGATRHVYWNGSAQSPRWRCRVDQPQGACPRRPRRRSSSSPRRRDPRLAYEVVTTGVKADQTPSRLHTIVDADTGATLTR